MKRVPWMPLYCDDMIGSTADMSCEELGAYFRLLCHIWVRGPIPLDETVICRIASTKKSVWRRISNRFSPTTRDDGTPGLSQTRLERERLRRHAFASERAESGRKGAAARWGGSVNGSVTSSRVASHNHNHNHIEESSVIDTTARRLAAPPPERAAQQADRVRAQIRLLKGGA